MFQNYRVAGYEARRGSIRRVFRQLPILVTLPPIFSSRLLGMRSWDGIAAGLALITILVYLLDEES